MVGYKMGLLEVPLIYRKRRENWTLRPLRKERKVKIRCAFGTHQYKKMIV